MGVELELLPGVGLLRYVLSIQRQERPVEAGQARSWDDFWRVTTLAGDIRAAIMAEFVEDGARVLDIGCGDGLLLYTLKLLKPRVRELGVDCSTVAIEKARARGIDAISLDVVQDMEKLLTIGSFDYVILAEVLEHIQQAEALLQTVVKLAPQLVLVTVPNSGHLAHRLRLLLGRFPIVEVVYHVSEHIRFWTVKDFLWWARALGFEVVAVRSVKGSRWGLHRLLPGLFSKQVAYALRPFR